jgi:hypothetical protein
MRCERRRQVVTSIGGSGGGYGPGVAGGFGTAGLTAFTGSGGGGSGGWGGFGGGSGGSGIVIIKTNQTVGPPVSRCAWRIFLTISCSISSDPLHRVTK